MPVVLKSRLDNIARDLPDGVDRATKKGATLIAAEARMRVAVSPYAPHLRDDIHVEPVALGAYAVVAGREETFYGHMVEFGTSHSAPHPFLIPSLESNREPTLRLVAAALDSL